VVHAGCAHGRHLSLRSQLRSGHAVPKVRLREIGYTTVDTIFGSPSQQTIKNIIKPRLHAVHVPGVDSE